MYYRQIQIDFTPDEVLEYLRKSQSDDPLLTVEEVLAKHEKILNEWAEKHLGGRVPEKNKFREIISGGEGLDDRPEMQRLLRLIENPKYKAVSVVEPQRLTRGDLEAIGRLMKILKLTNTLVLTPQKIYDLRDEYDFEAFERELKKGNDYLEYVKKIFKRGKLASISEGNYIGTRPPYGYDKIVVMAGKKKCPTLKINPEQADVVRLIFDLYVNKNMGTQKICNYLEEMGIKPPRGEHWTAVYIRKDLLSNIHYIGKVRWNFKKTVHVVEDGIIKKTRPKSKAGEYLIYDGKHEAIIDEKLFYAAQEKKGKNPRYPAKKKVLNPFASLVFCECNKAVIYKPYPNAKARMVCSDRKHCGNGSCYYDDFVDEICAVLEDCIADFEIRIQNNEGDSVKLHVNLIKSLEKRLKDLQAKELSQWEAQSDPNPANRMPQEIFQQLNAKLLKEKEEIQQALCKAQDEMPAPVNYEEKLCHFRDALAALKNPDVDPQEKNRLLKVCIERITYSREELKRVKQENGKYIPIKDGGGWNNPPIKIDVQLRV